MNGLMYYLRRLWWALIPNAAPQTTVVLGLNVILYLLQFWLGLNQPHQLESLLGLTPLWFSSHQYWQLVSYAWLHDPGNPLHLVVNMMMIRFIGEQMEWSLGPWRFWILYLGGVIAAGLAWLYTGPIRADSVIIGASGAAYALVTAYAVFAPARELKVWLFFVIPLRLTTRRLAFLLVASEFIMMHFHLLNEIAHTAHLGGAFFGWAIMSVWGLRSGDHYPVGGPVSRL